MAIRFGLGPVFFFEWLLSSRRWQLYAGRAAFVAILLASLAVVWSTEVSGRPRVSIRNQSAVGEMFYFAIIGTQLTLVLLAAPAATASAICLDKTRGTLAHVLVTDLANNEIILGKLAARLLPIFGMIACALPVMFLGTLLGGIDPEALFGSFLISLALGLFGCALALTISVWGHRTHEVLLATYLVIGVWLLFEPVYWMLSQFISLPLLQIATEKSNPFWLAFAPYVRPGSVTIWDFVGFFVALVLISCVLVTIAILRVRAVYADQLGRGPQDGLFAKLRVGGWLPNFPALPQLPGPSLDGNPVLWREWHRARPSRWTRVVWWVYGGGSTIFSFAAIVYILLNNRTGRIDEASAFVNGFQVAIGLLLLSVTAATSLAEERVRGSLDVLLATPLSTRSIVWGKWWGTFRRVPFLVVLPTLVAMSVAMHNPRYMIGVLTTAWLVLVYGAAITSLGLAFATWTPRLGRAVAATVTTYIVVTVGWFFLILTLFHANNTVGPGLASGSPFWGPMYQVIGMSERGGQDFTKYAIPWGVFWIIAYAAAALGLLLATMSSFDRAMGRISDGVSGLLDFRDEPSGGPILLFPVASPPREFTPPAHPARS